MKKLLLLIACLCLGMKMTSQENRKFLYASLKDEIGFIANAHIVNVNTNQGTFSNEKGLFKILAKPNDSLQISFVGYKTRKVLVSHKHFGIQETVFELQKTAIELDEVEVKKHNLLGYLSSDSKKIKAKKEVSAQSLKLPFAGSRILTPAERRLYTAMGGHPLKFEGLGFLLSTDYIINSISGRLKKLKKEKAIEDAERRIQQLHNNYHQYIHNDLKIISEDLARFIYFIESSKEFSPTLLSNEMFMITFLKRKSGEFKKLNPQNYESN